MTISLSVITQPFHRLMISFVTSKPLEGRPITPYDRLLNGRRLNNLVALNICSRELPL